MNALAIPALALAQRSVSAMPALFADLALRSPPADVVRLDSTGYAEEGKGAAQYISDGLCTEALLAAHPRCCFRAANGRIFRLFAFDGRIAVEQAGAAGDGTADDRGAIQAAIDYAEAVTAREVVFEAERYAVYCPVRTSPLSAKHAVDGHPLVVRKSLALRGAAAARTVLDFRGVGGADPEANWQTIAVSDSDPSDAVWRGGGLFVLGDLSDPAPAARSVARLELDRLILQGNRANTGVFSYPANPANGDGWDITDKAFWLQDSYAGEIVLTDVDMIGWKGEIFYLGGAGDAVERLTLKNCRFLTGNGSAFNPGVNAVLLAEDCEFGDCYQAQEDTAKSRAIYRGCLWRDCDHTGQGGGPTGDFQYHIVYPSRDDAKPLPLTVLDDCEFRSINQVIFSSWVQGSIRTVDAPVHVNGDQSMRVTDIDLSVDAWLDKANNINALALVGVSNLSQQVPGAPAGTFKEPPSHVRFRIRHFRSELAKREGRQWRGPAWFGYIGKSCRIETEGDFASQHTPNGGASPLSMPLVIARPGEPTTLYTSHGYYIPGVYSENGEIMPSGPLMAVAVGSEIALDMSIARWPAGGAEYGFAEGQKLRLAKTDGQGSIRFVKGQSPASFAVNQTRVLAAAHDWIEFTYNGNIARWEESGFFSSV